MTDHEAYEPGPADGASILKEGELWTLVLVRELRHAPEKVWRAITEPEHLRQWAPFEPDRGMGQVGTLSTTWVGAPSSQETTVTRAEPAHVLEFDDLRWELEAVGSGTRLTLWHSIDRNYIAMGAAGWHICFDVLDRLLAGDPLGRIVGPDAMKHPGWQRLHVEYAQQFGVKTPSW